MGILLLFKISVCVSKFIEYLYIIVFYPYDQVGGWSGYQFSVTKPRKKESLGSIA